MKRWEWNQPRWIARLRNNTDCFIERYKNLPLRDKLIDDLLIMGIFWGSVFLLLNFFFHFGDRWQGMIYGMELLRVPVYLVDVGRTAYKLKSPSAIIKYHWMDITLFTILAIFAIPLYFGIGRIIFLLRKEKLYKTEAYYPMSKVHALFKLHEPRK
jgi:hypothetical protein